MSDPQVNLNYITQMAGDDERGAYVAIRVRHINDSDDTWDTLLFGFLRPMGRTSYEFRGTYGKKVEPIWDEAAVKIVVHRDHILWLMFTSPDSCRVCGKDIVGTVYCSTECAQADMEQEQSKQRHPTAHIPVETDQLVAEIYKYLGDK